MRSRSGSRSDAREKVIHALGRLADTADSNRVGYVSDICVMPAYRGRRIAVELLSAIERHLARTGITRVRLASLPRTRRRKLLIRGQGMSRMKSSMRSVLPCSTGQALHEAACFCIYGLRARTRGPDGE
jgi:GNAT superfamily N-acetyltransferase